MPINILMPALSPTMEKGNLAKWHVKEGDSVKSGDVIAEIETDKATMEVEAVDEGKVGKILIAEGTSDVPVNEPIAVLLGEDEDAGAIQAAPPPAPKAAAAAPQAAPAKAEAPAPAAPKQAEAPRTNGAAPKAAANGQSVAGRENRVFASPLARRIAKDAGIDLNRVKGTGPHGRIVKRDVEEAKAGGGAALARPGAEAPRPTMAPSFTDQQIRDMYEAGSFEEKPHDGMRKTIARRLTESKQTIPHFYVTMDMELDALLTMRSQMNEASPKEGAGAYKLSVNDFVIKALALALQKVPMANATWTENARLLHKHSDIGVAVAIPDGLFTPVIRKAELKTLSMISNEMKDLATRARSKRLKPEEYQGGTTAVSNMGMYGVREFAAVINPPQATILAIGAGEQRVVVKNKQPAVATVMSCTLSCDHRVVDGVLGAELLGVFRGFIEHPVSMFV